ncbi:MAG: flagellar motor switch protein FliN [Gammaproteobacteria bacterium]
MSEQTEGKDMDAAGAAATPAQAAPDTNESTAQGGTDYERAAFQELGEEAAAAHKGETSLDVILDIPVTLSMEIGRSKISIQNLLQLARGSVVELDRMAGEPLDVLVNGTLVAHGEVVVVNDKFGVRLSDVVSPAERVNTLK